MQGYTKCKKLYAACRYRIRRCSKKLEKNGKFPGLSLDLLDIIELGSSRILAEITVNILDDSVVLCLLVVCE
jgi:hypothetical protein